MTPRQTVPERVSAWFMAYNAIRDELTSAKARQKLVSGEIRADDGERFERLIAANDRTAAMVAAMLVTSGIRLVPTGEEDGSE